MLLARQRRFQNVLLFRPSGSLEQQEFFISRRQMLRNEYVVPFVHIVFVFNAKALSAIRDAMILVSFSVFHRSIRSKKYQILKITLPH